MVTDMARPIRRWSDTRLDSGLERVDMGSDMRLVSFVSEKVVYLAIKMHDISRNGVISTERGRYEILQWPYLCL
jgi:hypothetical protein